MEKWYYLERMGPTMFDGLEKMVTSFLPDDDDDAEERDYNVYCSSCDTLYGYVYHTWSEEDADERIEAGNWNQVGASCTCGEASDSAEDSSNDPGDDPSD